MSARSRMTLVLAMSGMMAIVGAHASPPADAKTDVDWKALFPEADIAKLVAESVKVLQDATRSPTNFSAKGLKDAFAENEAYVLMIYAEAGMKSGDEALAKRCSALHAAAAALAQACKDKNLDEAKKQVTAIAGFKSMTADDVRAKPLSEVLPMKNLMKAVGKEEEEIKKYRRLTPAAFNTKTKQEEVAYRSQRMVALTAGITALAPAKDEDAKKTRKFWLESTAEVRDITVEMTTHAKGKKLEPYKAAVTRMSDSCVKCHDVYRVEKD